MKDIDNSPSLNKRNARTSATLSQQPNVTVDI